LPRENLNRLIERIVLFVAFAAQVADGKVALDVSHALAIALGRLVGPLLDQGV
jgi:hypothetical protein